MSEQHDVSLTDNLTRLQLISLDACTRCNECLKWCPVLDITEDESLTTPEKIRLYGELIRARHGLKARLLGVEPIRPEVLERLKEALYTCTTCSRCGEVCEVGINTQRLWPTLRAKMVELGVGPVGGQREAEAIVRARHNPYDRPHEQRFDWLPPDINLPQQAEVSYFAGCSGSYTAQPMVMGAVRVMPAAGIEFTLLDDEWCCGFPLFILGDLDLVRELITHDVKGFVDKGIERLAVSCPCCLFMVREQWPHYYGAELPFEVLHISQIVAERMRQGRLRLTRSLPRTVTYHDPCYLSRGVRLTEAPRQIIAQFPRARFVEMKDNCELSKCCGAGGGIRRAYTQLSIDMGRALIRDAEAVGAEMMVIDCPACYERLHLALEGFDSKLEIVDLMQLTAELL